MASGSVRFHGVSFYPKWHAPKGCSANLFLDYRKKIKKRSSLHSLKTFAKTSFVPEGFPSVKGPGFITNHCCLLFSIRSNASASRYKTPIWAPRPTPTHDDHRRRTDPHAQGQAISTQLTAANQAKGHRVGVWTDDRPDSKCNGQRQ